jgi:hypothetical protein
MVKKNRTPSRVGPPRARADMCTHRGSQKKNSYMSPPHPYPFALLPHADAPHDECSTPREGTKTHETHHRSRGRSAGQPCRTRRRSHGRIAGQPRRTRRRSPRLSLGAAVIAPRGLGTGKHITGRHHSCKLEGELPPQARSSADWGSGCRIRRSVAWGGGLGGERPVRAQRRSAAWGGGGAGMGWRRGSTRCAPLLLTFHFFWFLHVASLEFQCSGRYMWMFQMFLYECCRESQDVVNVSRACSMCFIWMLIWSRCCGAVSPIIDSLLSTIFYVANMDFDVVDVDLRSCTYMMLSVVSRGEGGGPWCLDVARHTGHNMLATWPWILFWGCECLVWMLR